MDIEKARTLIAEAINILSSEKGLYYDPTLKLTEEKYFLDLMDQADKQHNAKEKLFEALNLLILTDKPIRR